MRVGEPLHLERDRSDPEEWRRAGAVIMNKIGELLASIQPAVPDRRRPKKIAA